MRCAAVAGDTQIKLEFGEYSGRVKGGAPEGEGILKVRRQTAALRCMERHWQLGAAESEFELKHVEWYVALYFTSRVSQVHESQTVIIMPLGPKVPVMGGRYSGNFSFGKFHGQGTFFFPPSCELKTLSGEFEDGHAFGTGKLRFVSGSELVATFKDGRVHTGVIEYT